MKNWVILTDIQFLQKMFATGLLIGAEVNNQFAIVIRATLGQWLLEFIAGIWNYKYPNVGLQCEYDQVATKSIFNLHG